VVGGGGRGAGERGALEGVVAEEALVYQGVAVAEEVGFLGSDGEEGGFCGCSEGVLLACPIIITL
jgi:hypothetical protein